MKTAILTLVRHGETAANTDGVWHGATDTALSERGHLQAQRVGEHLVATGEKFAHIYSSPLERACHTAEAIDAGLGLGIEKDPGLSEYDLGSWEGKTYKELHTDYRLWENMKENPDFAPHGGESPRQVVDRYVAALHQIAKAHPGDRVIVVGHGGAFSMALAHLVEGTYTSWGPVMSNCAVSELWFEPEVTLKRFNVTGHLEGI